MTKKGSISTESECCRWRSETNKVEGNGSTILLVSWIKERKFTLVPLSCSWSQSIPLSMSLQRLTGYLHSQGCPPYVINLDPAVHEVPFPANIGE